VISLLIKSLGCLRVSLTSPGSILTSNTTNRTASNVGNKIAVFTMQSLGCNVAALNTVQFSASNPRPTT